jgi:endonuclease YncB( thermonuclease family)
VRRGGSFLISLLIVALVAAIAEGVREWGAMRDHAPRLPDATGAPLTGRARVVDGDSLEIAGQRIRLFGIDAPELHQDCTTKAGRVYACGQAARRALDELTGGRAVTCTPLGQSHDRAVALCRADGRDLGEEQVRSGHALELWSFSRGRYSAAERDARAARRGLWAGGFEEPAQWRREHGR